MNKFIYIILFVFATILLMLVGYSAYFVNYTNHIELGRLKWNILKDNQSMLNDSMNNTVLGPCYINLWGKYPYIYGNFYTERNPQAVVFVIDLRDENLSIKKIDNRYYLHELEKRNLDYSIITGYWSLKGQWGDKNLLNSLQKSINQR